MSSGPVILIGLTFKDEKLKWWLEAVFAELELYIGRFHHGMICLGHIIVDVQLLISAGFFLLTW